MGAGLGKRAVQGAVGAQVVGGRHQEPGESCGGEKRERQESPPATPSHPSPPSPLPTPQPSPSCRTWLGSIVPGVSTACVWTDLREDTESSGVRRGTPAPAEQGASGQLPLVSDQAPPSTCLSRPGKGFLEPTLTPKHQSLPRLTADRAAESSLLFIRFPSSGRRNWG